MKLLLALMLSVSVAQAGTDEPPADCIFEGHHLGMTEDEARAVHPSPPAGKKNRKKDASSWLSGDDSLVFDEDGRLESWTLRYPETKPVEEIDAELSRRLRRPLLSNDLFRGWVSLGCNLLVIQVERSAQFISIGPGFYPFAEGAPQGPPPAGRPSLRIPGFSFDLPGNGDWDLLDVKRDWGRLHDLHLRRTLAGGRESAIAISSFPIETPLIPRTPGATEAVRLRSAMILHDVVSRWDRFDLVSQRLEETRVQGRTCLAFRQTAVEKRGPNRGRHLEISGVACSHPDSPGHAVFAAMGQTIPAGQNAIPLQEEVNSFLGSVVFEPFGARIDTIPVGRYFCADIAVSGSTAWLHCSFENRLLRVGVDTGRVLEDRVIDSSRPIPAVDQLFLVTSGSVGSGVRRLVAVDDASSRLLASRPQKRLRLDMMRAHGSLWVLERKKSLWRTKPVDLTRLDFDTGRELARVRGVAHFGSRFVTGGDLIMVLHPRTKTLLEIDPETNRVVAELQSPISLKAAVVHTGELWIAGDGTVIRLNRETGQPDVQIDLDEEPANIIVHQNSLWVELSTTVVRVDPASGTIVGNPIPLGWMHGRLVSAGDSLWVANVDGTIQKITPEPLVQPDSATVK